MTYEPLNENARLDDDEDDVCDFDLGDDADEEEEPEYEPQDEDLITEDFRRFFTIGKSYGFPLFFRGTPDFVVGDDEDWQVAVLNHMQEIKFWPNVWSLSDHGNLSLLGLGDDPPDEFGGTDWTAKYMRENQGEDDE